MAIRLLRGPISRLCFLSVRVYGCGARRDLNPLATAAEPSNTHQ